jgi:HEAT repeat protein
VNQAKGLLMTLVVLGCVGLLSTVTNLRTVHAGEALGLVGGGQATDAELVKRLDSTDPDLRFKAVLKLGLAREAAAIEPLARLRDDQLWQIREAVGWALGRMKDPRALDVLIDGLNKDEFATYAAIALGEMGEAKAVEPLLRALEAPEKDTRGAAIESLGILKDSRAVEPLLALVKDKTIYTSRREISVELDKESGDAKFAQTMTGSAIYRSALNSLVKIGDKSAIGALTKLMESETDEEIRKAIEDTLKQLR